MSTPASRRCRYAPGVMPDPPDAFSALAMHRSMHSRSIRGRSTRLRKVTPGGPTMSPRKRMRISQIRNPKSETTKDPKAHQVRTERRASCAFVSFVVADFALARVFHRPRLAHDGYFNFAGIVQLLLNGAGDVPAHFEGVTVAGLARVG